MIREMRLRKGMTQEALAIDCGVSQQCVARWENGDTSPRASLLPKVADALECTIDELLRPRSEEKGEGE